MNNINCYGIYEVGSSKKGILVSRSEGIQLRLRESRSKRIHKLHYNLDELRDLESKLVLITGRETKERKEVDLFLDVSYYNNDIYCRFNNFCAVIRFFTVFVGLLMF